MNYFWVSLSEICRERNSLPTFFAALLAFFGLVALGVAANSLFSAAGWEDYEGYFLASAAVVFCALLILGIRRQRVRAREQRQFAPLSRDEITKAQCKLNRKSPAP